MIMGFIDTMRVEGHAIESICRVLSEQGCRVAARTYRAWKDPHRVIAARTYTDAAVIDAIRTACTTTGPDGRVHATPESLYGRRKMTAHLRRHGHTGLARCTVDRAMTTLGMSGIRRAKGVRTTVPRKGDPRAADLLRRDFTAPAPNRVWVADFERHEAFANPGGGGRPSRDACRSRRVEAGGRSAASAWGWLVEQSSTTTSRLSTARWGGLG
jgi:putative transposase